MTTSLWTAHPDCPEHIKTEFETRIRSFPSSFLSAPTAGEVFDNPDICQERLQGWILSQGFTIIRKSDNVKTVRPRFEFRCIHHEVDIQNDRQLKKYVKRDEEDRITNRRKQEIININVRNCLYYICLIYKQVNKRDSSVFDFVLSIRHNIYIYLMIINLLRYKKKYIKTFFKYLFTIELNKSF